MAGPWASLAGRVVASPGAVARCGMRRRVAAACGEGGVADHADGVVEVPKDLTDALLGRICGQAGGGLQAEPGVEQAGDDGVEQFPAAALEVGDDCGPGQVGEMLGPGEVADDGESEMTGWGGDRAEADLGRECSWSLRRPASRAPVPAGRAAGACARLAQWLW